MTYAGLTADVARTMAALPEADWNESESAPRELVPRTGRVIWGPRDAVEYRPRWKTDHHPWAVVGPSGELNGIRYANHEVDEDGR